MVAAEETSVEAVKAVFRGEEGTPDWKQTTAATAVAVEFTMASTVTKRFKEATDFKMAAAAAV